MNAPFFFAAEAALRTAFPHRKSVLFFLLLLLACFAALLPSAARAQLYTETITLPTGGQRVSISGDTILLGFEGNIPAHQDAPTYGSEVWVRGTSGWVFQQRVTHKGGDAAIDGDTLVVGDSIYVRSDGVWTKQASVGLDDRMRNAIQGDTVAIAMPRDRAQAWGFVTVFVRDGTTWTEQGRFGPPSNELQEMGNSLALDGDIIVAGTKGYGGRGFGAHVFVRSGGTWARETTLSLPGAGESMDVAIEGNLAAVSDPTNNRIGFFTRAGTSWTLTETLSGPAGTSFGSRVVMRSGILAVKTSQGLNLYTRGAAGWALAQSLPGVNFDDAALAEGGKTLVTGMFYNPSADTNSKVYSVPPPPAPGSGWRDYDIGAVGVAGSSGDDGTTVTVRGSGSDIWDRADQFHFRSESLTGDGAIVARVNSTGGGHPWAKVGLMAREDIAPASRNVMALVSPGDHLGTQVRSGTNDVTAWQDGGWAGAPIWLMLARSGNLFGSYASADGENWTPIGSATVNMPPTIHVGLAVSSHDNAALNTATFSNVEIVGLPPPDDPPAAPANLQAGNQTASTVTLSWTDNSSDETGFEVQRSEGDGSGAFTVVTTTAANATSYVDSALIADTQYTYRVRATRDGIFSANSNTFTVRTLTNSDGEWTSADIGMVGSAGSTSASGSAVTLTAGGEDMWNQADGFRFYYRPWSGDGSVTARVTGLANTHPWAKAGVMFRESLAPGAADAAMVLTADNVCGFLSRPSSGAATDFTGGPWLNAPYWVRITRSGNLFSGYISPDGVTWTLIGSRTIAMGSSVYIGLAACSHTTTSQTVASFENVTVPDGPPPPPPPPPGELQGGDTGAVGVPGSFTFENGVYALNGSGVDIWGKEDSFYGAAKGISGDFDMRVRVTSLINTHPWAKAGIMARESGQASSANVAVLVTADNVAGVQVRTNTFNETTFTAGPWLNAPCWLRLKRVGTIYTGYVSVDGVNWQSIWSGDVQLPTNTGVALVTTSHDNTRTTRATFTDLTFN